MKHLGDITKIYGYDVPIVDIVTGGSPCQDLSVAGKREGLAGERSGLFMEQIRIIKEMRENDRRNNGRTDEHIRPRYMVWENVPGAFSSNKGEDFRCVLEETAKVADSNATIPRLKVDKSGKQKWSKSGCIMGDGWSIAWRVHDAQFWGVPQRRKRISLVADFGGETAPEILFERESVSWDTKEGGEEREGTTEDAERGIGETSRAVSFQERARKPGGGKGILIQDEHTGALSTLNNQSVCYPINTMVASRNNNESRTTFGVGDNGEAQFTLSAAHEHAVCYGICSDKSNSMLSGNPHSGIYEADTSRTLDLNGGSPACNQGGMAVVQKSAGVCNSVVRRLTPLECERLQGFPDHWTDIGEWYDSKGKKHKDADSPRYKALGNSIALPFWQWMAERICKQYDRPTTMASLFDGISGFCLVFARAGAKPVFSSEIEEFPIAVAKKHFGDDEKGVKGDYEKYL